MTNPNSVEVARAAKIARYMPAVWDGKLGVPVSFQVALTDTCFNRCIGCGHPQRVQKKMVCDDWLNFLSQRTGVESVCYSGGDPMAYVDFNKVMQWHVDHYVAFGMTITGFVPSYIDLVLMRNATWVRASLDAVDADVYAVVRGKTPLPKVLDSIEKMVSHGVNVELGVTLHPANEGQLPKIKAYADFHGIKTIHSRYAYPNSNPQWTDVDQGQRGVVKFNHCRAVFYQLYIDSDGSTYPCCITAGDTRKGPQANSLGNIYKEPWPVIWDRTVEYSRLELAQLPDICRSCCVKRLSEINGLCDEAVNSSGQSFF